jgi:hypothetical protein
LSTSKLKRQFILKKTILKKDYNLLNITLKIKPISKKPSLLMNPQFGPFVIQKNNGHLKAKI